MFGLEPMGPDGIKPSKPWPKPPNTKIIINFEAREVPLQSEFDRALSQISQSNITREGEEYFQSRPWGSRIFEMEYFRGCMASPGRRAKATPLDVEYY